MNSSKEKTNAFLIHLTALLGFLFPFAGILIPLIVWKAQRNESMFLNANGKEAVNFNITFGFYKIILVIGLVTSFFVMSILHKPAMIILLLAIYALFEIMSTCLILIAASKAQKGEIYSYPMTVKFLK